MADTVRFVIPADGDGARLDQALARGVPGLSRRRARVLIDLGGVFVDKRPLQVAGRLVRAGQRVEANLGGASSARSARRRPAPSCRCRSSTRTTS
jgi:23S rRNA pseudouridine1911/1915/1917 synthase